MSTRREVRTEYTDMKRMWLRLAATEKMSMSFPEWYNLVGYTFQGASVSEVNAHLQQHFVGPTARFAKSAPRCDPLTFPRRAVCDCLGVPLRAGDALRAADGTMFLVHDAESVCRRGDGLFLAVTPVEGSSDAFTMIPLDDSKYARDVTAFNPL